VPAESHARTYSLNDSSDDEIVIPMMKFSAETNALLNDAALAVERSSPNHNRNASNPEESYKVRGVNTGQDGIPPPDTRVHSPFPRRIVRLSGTPGSSTLRRRSSTLSSAVRKHNEQQAAPKTESPLDLSTPAPVPRTVRIPITNSGSQGRSGSSSGNASSKTDSASRNEEAYPATIVKSQLATSQGSVSRYGTMGRAKYGEEAGLQSSMRTKPKINGKFLSGPARRGKIRKNDEEQSPMEEQGDGLDAAGLSQEPQSQESQAPESQSQGPGSSQESEVNRADIYPPSYRDFASGSPVSNKEAINSILRSKSPPPPTLVSFQRSAGGDSNARAPLQPIQPVFKVPAPRPDLPSAHDQENEAPPTFKRNKQAPLIHLDKMEQVPVRPESIDMSALRSAGSPERRALAPRSQNTPRRPAPPPPKMSILDAATSNAGAATTSNAGGKRNRMKVNGKYYTKLDCIGRGGSSRVYRVMAENSKFLALKRVTFDDGVDDMTRRGFEGEIDLLEKLKGVDRVIRLYDHEMNEEKGVLSVVSVSSL
jgi:serine/threonine-protein kinase TTK/MPS1